MMPVKTRPETWCWLTGLTATVVLLGCASPRHALMAQTAAPSPLTGAVARATPAALLPEGCAVGLTEEWQVESLGDEVCVSSTQLVVCPEGRPCAPASLVVRLSTERTPARGLVMSAAPAVPGGPCTRGRRVLQVPYRGCLKNDGWLGLDTAQLTVAPQRGTGVQFVFGELPSTAAAVAVTKQLPRKKEDPRRGLHVGGGLSLGVGFLNGVVLGGALQGHVEYSFGWLGLRASPRLLVETSWGRWIATGGTVDTSVHFNLGRVFTLLLGAAIGVVPTAPTRLFYFAPSGGLALKFGRASNIQTGLSIEWPVTGQPPLLLWSLAFLFGPVGESS